MKILMDLELSASLLHCMHAIYIQMSQSWLLSQSWYVKFENRDISKFSQSLRPTSDLGIDSWKGTLVTIYQKFISSSLENDKCMKLEIQLSVHKWL